MRMYLCPFQSSVDKKRLEPFTWFGLTDETTTSFLLPIRCSYDEESLSSQGLVPATCLKGGSTWQSIVLQRFNSTSLQFGVQKIPARREPQWLAWCPAPPAPGMPHRNGCQNQKKKKQTKPTREENPNRKECTSKLREHGGNGCAIATAQCNMAKMQKSEWNQCLAKESSGLPTD